MAKKCSAKISKFTIDKNAKIRSEKYAEGDENSKAQMFFIAFERSIIVDFVALVNGKPCGVNLGLPQALKI